MKILHIIDHTGIGGAQTLLKEIFEHEKNNKNIFCYVLRNNKIKLEMNCPNLYLCKSYRKFDIRSLFKLKKIIKDQDIDVLHCHLLKSIFWGYLLKLLFFRDIKLVFHEHGEIYRTPKWYNFSLKKTQNKTNLFIAVSKATKNKLVKNAGINPDKIKVLYNFVDLNKFNSKRTGNFSQIKARKKIGLNEDNFVIGFAGRLDKMKGCDILIKSIPYIKIKNLKILIAGSGTERKKLEKLSKKLNVKNKTIFLDYIENIINFYGTIDVLVIPSRFEPFGLVVIEAQATGVPVVASAVSGLNEIISDGVTGLLFEPENEKDLAEKIELVCNNKKLREKLIENGLENVRRYSLDNYLIELKKAYNKLF